MSKTMDPTQLIPSLDPASDALVMQGRHLIEASAGTGKTYNITRLYLRLLLEEGLSVQQILVVTFTKAATEELRGRIGRELRAVLGRWESLPTQGDAFEQRLYRQCAASEGGAARGHARLEQALLELDEAAIYTIHGFCQRALRQQAFASGLPFQVSMEADISKLLQEAVEDYYRRLAADEALFVRFTAFNNEAWKTPQHYSAVFHPLLVSDVPLQVNTRDDWFADAKMKRVSAEQSLRTHEARLRSALVSNRKKPAEIDQREAELQTLLAWVAASVGEPMPQPARDFIHGNRYRGNDEVKAILEPVKAYKDAAEACHKQHPDPEADEQAWAAAYEGIIYVRQHLAQAKQQQQVLDFNDLINKLHATLCGDQGEALASALAAQYPALLVDEFQDTDPRQYQIFDRIHRQAKRQCPQTASFFMIGDPKQAIYSFRGGDVFAYLQARQDADCQWQLDSNWRSVAGVVEGYNRLFRQQEEKPFEYGIPYHPVQAKKHFDPAQASKWQQDGRTPLQLVWFDLQPDYAAGREDNPKSWHKAEFRTQMAQWVANECVRLLQGEACPPVQAKDIAVLVRSATEAQTIRTALAACGLPSVYLSTRENVFKSPQAMELWRALGGILEPENLRRRWQAWASALFGLGAEGVARLRADEQAQADLQQYLGELRQLWQKQGFIAMALQLLHRQYVPQAAQRERELTNLLQLIELLQQASVRLHQPLDLFNYLAQQIAAPDTNAEHELRLESDAAFVRIVTHHGSKGLEYPVVFLPFFSYHTDPLKLGNKMPAYFAWHAPDTFEARVFLGENAHYEELARREGYAEQMRLFYVAMTRPVHRCYLLASLFDKGEYSPLGRLMPGLNGDALQQWCDALPGHASVLRVDTEILPEPYRQDSTQSAAALAPARLTQTIDQSWQLSSFSALKHRSEHSGGSLAKDHDRQPAAASATATAAATLPRFALTGGARLGNLLHDVLEHTDFPQPRWGEARTQTQLSARIQQSGLAIRPQAVQDWLDDCLGAPLVGHAPAYDGLTLARLAQGDTLRETEFYFPMQRGLPQALIKLLGQHRGQSVNLDLRTSVLNGMLHGFIDLIFCWQGRYFVADYKSNHLGNQFDDYDQPQLLTSVQTNLYDLQYLLYSLALHRYLQQRLPGYDPARHFGGVYYLYLRGMSAQRSPDQARGVFYRPISADLLAALDALFKGPPSPSHTPGDVNLTGADHVA